jgi:hypothetical protein
MPDLFPTHNKDMLCKCGEELDKNNYCVVCDVNEAHDRLEQMVEVSVLAVRKKELKK